MPLNPYEDWPESLALTLLIIGFILSLLARSILTQLIIIILAGLVFGRLLHRWKPHKKLSLVLIMLGFLLGYILGSASASPKILVVLFFLAVFAGWKLEQSKIFKTAIFTSAF